ncbi:MAG TPA: methyltransferase [Chitinophagaceae bacterium]|nr:methyltransferase [Chitinophagaceae bacterium]
MSNSMFRFREFVVHQDSCVMKVSTDACLLGAFSAFYLRNQGTGDCQHILDIGTGTGLLALMLAQKCDACIDGVELDEGAWKQAGQNFRDSPWKDCLHALHGDIRTMTFLKKYDVIITNPPFYEFGLKSRDSRVNMAKHSGGLDLQSLIASISRNLSNAGICIILLPPVSFQRFVRMAEGEGFYLTHKMEIYPSQDKPVNRCIGIFSRISGKMIQEELQILQKGGGYSTSFIALLKDYYLDND